MQRASPIFWEILDSLISINWQQNSLPDQIFERVYSVLLSLVSKWMSYFFWCYARIFLLFWVLTMLTSSLYWLGRFDSLFLKALLNWKRIIQHSSNSNLCTVVKVSNFFKLIILKLHKTLLWIKKFIKNHFDIYVLNNNLISLL